LHDVTAMQPAFLSFLLPPPSAGALLLAGPDCARARCAADRHKASVVKGIVGNAVFADERENPLAGPVEQRVDLNQPVMRIDSGKRDAGALVRLIGTQAGDPCGGSRKRAPERFHLADLAARFPGHDRGVKSVDALAGDKGLDTDAIRIECMNASTISALGPGPELVGFRKIAARYRGSPRRSRWLG